MATETDVVRKKVSGQNQCEPCCSLPCRLTFIPVKKTHGSYKQQPSLVFICHSGNFIVTSPMILIFSHLGDLACSSKASGKGKHFGKVTESFLLEPIHFWMAKRFFTLTGYLLSFLLISQDKYFTATKQSPETAPPGSDSPCHLLFSLSHLRKTTDYYYFKLHISIFYAESILTSCY